jgi:hypothetical protein
MLEVLRSTLDERAAGSQRCYPSRHQCRYPSARGRVVFGWLAATAARQGLRQAQCGAVTAIQRFGSALNLNLLSRSKTRRTKA